MLSLFEVTLIFFETLDFREELEFILTFFSSIYFGGSSSGFTTSASFSFLIFLTL